MWLSVRRHRRTFALSWGRPRLRGLVCQLSSTRCGRWVRLRALTGSKRSLADRSLASMKIRVHSAMVRIPYRVPHHLSTVRPAGRSRLPWSSRRPTTASSCKPRMKRTTRFRSGSALRFSQPLSGFLASSSSTALFRAATVPERPLQSVPLTKIANPSRGRMLPRGYPPASSCAPPATLTPRFPRLPRTSAVAWFPRRLEASFPRAEARFPVTLGHGRSSRPTPLASPTSKRSSLRESVRGDASFPSPPAVALLGFCPFRDPTKPRILEPARTRGPEHAPSPEGSSVRPTTPTRPEGYARLASQVRPHRRPKAQARPRRRPTPERTEPRRLSTAFLLPWP